jgi:hypothetical protein
MAKPNTIVNASPTGMQAGKPQTIVINNKPTTLKNAQGQVCIQSDLNNICDNDKYSNNFSKSLLYHLLEL